MTRRSVIGAACTVLHRPTTIAQVKQAPLFPGMYRHVKRFEGEHVYHYGRHTLCILQESIGVVVFVAGTVLGVAGYFYVQPSSWQGVLGYGAALLLLCRLLARGRSNRLRRDLTGRHVLVTGGSSGVGRATAAQLARMGADVTIVSRDSPHVQPALAFIRAQCRNAKQQHIGFSALDLADFVAVREYCKRALHRGRPIDLLIHSAGVIHPRQVMTRFGEDELIAVNLLGPYLLTEGLLPLVRAAHGRIVYVTCSAHIAVRDKEVMDYIRGTTTSSSSSISTNGGRKRKAGQYDSLAQYGFAKLGNLYHAQELACRAYTAGAANHSSSTAKIAGEHRSNGTAAAARHQTLSHTSSSLRGEAGAGERRKHDEATPAYTTCACTPGGALTNLYRYMPSYMWIYYGYYALLLFLRTAWEGSQGVVNCALREELRNGGYYMNCRYRPNGLSAAACDVKAREQMMAWLRHKMQPYMKWD